MSSTIKLYEHNQKTYDALLDMLGERDRACIIKPTGTGKFVIIAKMVQDNPDKRFLLLGTNDYMFNDQMANLAEIAPGFTPENLQFMTYSAAMMAARRGEEMSPGGLMMVTAMSRMRPSHISAHWKEAARSGRSSLRRTSIWHGWNTRQTVIRRSTVTWIR